MFSRIVLDHWRAPRDQTPGRYRVVVDAALPENRSLSLLRFAEGSGVVTLTPEVAATLDLSGDDVEVEALTRAIEAAGIPLNEPDHLFYLPLAGRPARDPAAPDATTRQLTIADEAAFAAMTADAPADDLDEAFVELDHWLVYGTFVGERLVAAASMFPWRGTRLADLGVITLPAFRGRGLATRAVRAISARALESGFEPQYRCQLDNAASVALARAAGFERFGEWTVIDAG